MTSRALAAGNFYGEVRNKRETGGVILSEIRHGHGRALPAHTHEFAYFSLLLYGGYTEHFGKTSAVYKPMNVMFHPPHFEHRDEIAASGGRFFSIEIQPAWLERLRECLNRVEITPQLHHGELVWLAMKVFKQQVEWDVCSPLAIEGLLLEMLAIAAGSSFAKENDRSPRWLLRAEDLLRSEFQHQLTLAYISRAVDVNPIYLSRSFRKLRGQTIHDYINKLRVEFCCRQLRDRELPLAVIAQLAGFSDQSHFTRIFKRETGFTPNSFRQLLINK